MKKIALLSFCLLATYTNAQSLGQLAKQSATEKPKTEMKTVGNASTVENKANNGDAQAQLALGSYYAKGTNGFTKDATKAIYWLEKSASQNNIGAMLYLGYIYGEGKLLKADMQKAIYWRELSAQKGSANDKWSLGNAYLFGFSLPKDQNRALYWIKLSADEGKVEALFKLVEIYKNIGRTEEYNLYNAKIAQLEIKSATNDDKNKDAMLSVAKRFIKGDGVDKNQEKAVYWLKKAADANNIEAIDIIANMYAEGKYVKKDSLKAQAYYKKLANLDPQYNAKISQFYLNGSNGFPIDKFESIKWYEKSAITGDTSMRIYLIWKYWDINNLASANAWCEIVIDELNSIISSIKDKKNIQLAMAKENLRVVKTMKVSIENKALSPLNFNEYYRNLMRAGTKSTL